jgi:hypothetical protein
MILASAFIKVLMTNLIESDVSILFYSLSSMVNVIALLGHLRHYCFISEKRETSFYLFILEISIIYLSVVC